MQVYWKEGRLTQPRATLEQTRDKVKRSLEMLRSDHKRNLNPTPYKVRNDFMRTRISNWISMSSHLLQVAVSDDLYSFIHDLWLQNAPIGMLECCHKKIVLLIFFISISLSIGELS